MHYLFASIPCWAYESLICSYRLTYHSSCLDLSYEFRFEIDYRIYCRVLSIGCVNRAPVHSFLQPWPISFALRPCVAALPWNVPVQTLRMRALRPFGAQSVVQPAMPALAPRPPSRPRPVCSRVLFMMFGSIGGRRFFLRLIAAVI